MLCNSSVFDQPTIKKGLFRQPQRPLIIMRLPFWGCTDSRNNEAMMRLKSNLMISSNLASPSCHEHKWDNYQNLTRLVDTLVFIWPCFEGVYYGIVLSVCPVPHWPATTQLNNYLSESFIFWTKGLSGHVCALETQHRSPLNMLLLTQ